MKNEIALVFIFVFTPKISCVLQSCSQSVSITQLCNRFENYRANTAPKPWPVIVNPIIDFKNILEIESDEKTMTVYINFIMNWIDQEIYVNPADGKKYAFCTINMKILGFTFNSDNPILMRFSNKLFNRKLDCMKYTYSTRNFCIYSCQLMLLYV